MDLVLQLDARIRGPPSGSPVVVMVQTTQNRTSDHLVPRILRGRNQSMPFRDLLPNPLMRSYPIEVIDIGVEHALELLLAEDEQMVQAFLPHTSQEALADGVGSWCMNRRLEQLDVTGRRHPEETGSKLAVVITDEILRCLPKRGCFPKLLRHPGIGRRSCDATASGSNPVWASTEVSHL